MIIYFLTDKLKLYLDFSDEAVEHSIIGKNNDSASVGRTTMQRLSQKEAHYKPDYTVRAVTDLEYLRIDRDMYKNALQSTVLERQVANITESKDSDLYRNEIEEDRYPGITSSLVELNKKNSTAVNKTGSLTDIRIEMSPLLTEDKEASNRSKDNSNV